MLEDDTFFITEVSLSDGGLQQVAGALADHGGAAAPPGGRGWLRSWVTGWTHCLDVDPLGLPQPEPIAGVGRLAEAVVDVLLERRPLEQMRRWLSRDVVGQLTGPNGLGGLANAGGLTSVGGFAGAGSSVSGGSGGAGGGGGLGGRSGANGRSSAGGMNGKSGKSASGSKGGTGSAGAGPAAPSPTGSSALNGAIGVGPSGGERRTPRFASRSMIRSVRLHQPAVGIVESTVVIQDGPRVRAVALRFEQSAPAGPGRQSRPTGFDWLCTALQFN
jgi:hypothetical protein